MEIENLLNDINIVCPTRTQKTGKKVLADLIKNRNNDRLNQLGDEIPRIFFEALFLQEPYKLKTHLGIGTVVGKKEEDENKEEEREEGFFYNKTEFGGDVGKLAEWEYNAFRFTTTTAEDSEEDSKEDSEEENEEDSGDEDDVDSDNSLQKLVIQNIDKHFSNFFSPSVYLLYKKLIKYLFLLRGNELTFENCIPVFIRNASIRNTTSTIIYFGIYTKQSFEDNPTMTHYDFLYFENGKKTFQQYQDNIVSFLKQSKRNEHKPLTRINPIILDNPQLFFHNDGILEIEKTNVNKEFMRIKEDGLDFWLTYLFIDNQHDLVGGQRIFDSLPKYTKGPKNWKKYFSHISIFRLFGTMFHNQSMDINDSSTNDYRINSDDTSMDLLKLDSLHLNYVSPDTQHYYIVKREQEESIFDYGKGHSFTMKSPHIKEILIPFGDTSYLADNDWLEYNKINIVRGLDNESTLSGMSGIWGSLKTKQIENDKAFNEIYNIRKPLFQKFGGGKNLKEHSKKKLIQHGGIGEANVDWEHLFPSYYKEADKNNIKSSQKYFSQSWKSNLQKSSDHLRIVVDSSKKGKVVSRFTGGDGDGDENMVGAESAMADASVYSGKEIPRTLVPLNILMNEEQYENPFIYPLFYLPKTQSKSQGGWIFIEVKKKLITNKDIANSRKINKLFLNSSSSASSAGTSTMTESDTTSEMAIFNKIMEESYTKYVVKSDSFSKETKERAKAAKDDKDDKDDKGNKNDKDDKDADNIVYIGYNNTKFSNNFDQVDYPFYAHSMTFHYFTGVEDIESCYQIIKGNSTSNNYYQATILQTEKTPGVSALFKLLVQIGLVITESVVPENILNMFSMIEGTRVAPLADTQCKLILQLKLILQTFVTISRNDKPHLETLRSWIEVVDHIERKAEPSCKDKYNNWIAKEIIKFEEYPEGLIDTIALAIKTTGDIQRATDSVFERAYLVTFDGFLRDMIYYGFMCKCIYDEGKNLLEIFDATGVNNKESKESEESSIVNTPSIINKSNLQLLLKHVFTDGVFFDKNRYDFPNLKLSNVDLSEWNSQKNEKYWVFEDENKDGDKFLFPQHILFLQLYGFILITIYLKIKNKKFKLISVIRQVIRIDPTERKNLNYTDTFITNFDAAYKILIKSLKDPSEDGALLTTEPRIRRIYLAYSSFINTILGTDYDIRYPKKEPSHFKNDEMSESSDKDLVNLHSKVLDLLSNLKKCSGSGEKKEGLESHTDKDLTLKLLADPVFKTYQVKGILYSEDTTSFIAFITESINNIKSDILDESIHLNPDESIITSSMTRRDKTEQTTPVIKSNWEKFTIKPRNFKKKHRGAPRKPVDYDPYFYFANVSDEPILVYFLNNKGYLINKQSVSTKEQTKEQTGEQNRESKNDETTINFDSLARQGIHFKNWSAEAREIFINYIIQIAPDSSHHNMLIFDKMVRNVAPNFWRYNSDIPFRLNYIIENQMSDDKPPFISYLEQFTKLENIKGGRKIQRGGNRQQNEIITKLKEKIKEKYTKINKKILYELLEEEKKKSEKDVKKDVNKERVDNEIKFNKKILKFIKGEGSKKISKLLDNIIEELNLLIEKINKRPTDVKQEKVSINELIKSIIELSMPINIPDDIEDPDKFKPMPINIPDDIEDPDKFKLNNFLFVFDKLDQYLSLSNSNYEIQNKKLANESINQRKILLSSNDLMKISDKDIDNVLEYLNETGNITFHDDGGHDDDGLQEINLVLIYLYPQIAERIYSIIEDVGHGKTTQKQSTYHMLFRVLAHLQNWLTYKLPAETQKIIDIDKIRKKSKSDIANKRRGGGDFIGVHPTKWDYRNDPTSIMRMTNILNTLLTEENFENITEKILAGTTLKEAKDTGGKNKNGGGNKKRQRRKTMKKTHKKLTIKRKTKRIRK